MLKKIYRQIARFEISRYNIYSGKLPRNFDGLKIIHLSDLHNRVFGRDNIRIFERVKNENPDLVFMTGDMISHKAKNNREFLELVRRLAKKYPVYYVNGNHEFSDIDEKDFSEISDRMKSYGAVCLDNRSVVLSKGGQNLKLCGLTYPAEYYKGVREYKYNWKKFTLDDMSGFMEFKPDGEFTALLAHNPLDFPVHAEWGADISFGGHVHGGLIRLPFVKGVLSPERRLFPKYKEGIYHRGGSSLVVSRGLGRFRVFNLPEVVKVTLRTSDATDARPER